MNKFLLVLVVAAVSSCNVLTESQIKNINAFGTSTKSYSAFPSAVLKKRAELHFDEALVKTIQLPTSDLMKQNIENARREFDKAAQLSDTFDLSLQLIQQYAGLLIKLSSESYVDDLNKNGTELNENLSNLVDTYNKKFSSNKLPTGLSAAISKAIFLVGERLTRGQQAKELKKFIPQGDVLIQVTVKNLVEVFESDTPSLKSELENERTVFINTYTNVVLNNSSRVNYSSIRQYAEALDNYDNLEALRATCVEAARSLAAAHAQLTKNIQRKMELKEIITETQNLIASVQELYKLLNALHGSNPS